MNGSKSRDLRRLAKYTARNSNDKQEVRFIYRQIKRDYKQELKTVNNKH